MPSSSDATLLIWSIVLACIAIVLIVSGIVACAVSYRAQSIVAYQKARLMQHEMQELTQGGSGVSRV